MLRCGGDSLPVQRSMYDGDGGSSIDGQVPPSGTPADGGTTTTADASATGPSCHYSPTSNPECVGAESPVSAASGSVCQPSISFTFPCNDEIIGDTRVRGCCALPNNGVCGFRTTLAGQAVCVDFEPPGIPAPDCPTTSLGGVTLLGCRDALGDPCKVRYRIEVDGIELDFGCIWSSFLPAPAPIQNEGGAG